MYLIKLWYALNSNEKVIKIEDIKKDTKGEEYFCPCCGAEVFPRALNSEKIRPHFCHKKGESCSEEEIHKWVKKDLFKVGQSIKVNTCKGIKEYIIKDILIEKTYKTSVGDYRPDISLVTEDGSVIFVEVCNTNKKSIEKYFDKWFELGNTVIEIKAKEVIENNFNLDILEPIYDDDDRFRHFEESDYKKLFGTKNEEKREYLKQLYESVYNYIKGECFITNILRLADPEAEIRIKDNICNSIADNIIKDIKYYKFLINKSFTYLFNRRYFSNAYGFEYWSVIALHKNIITYEEFKKYEYTKFDEIDIKIDKNYLYQGIEEYAKIIENFKYNESRYEIMEDKKIICKDCGKEFIFTVGEQEFFKDKGYDHEPKRCIECRRKRRQAKKENKE